MCCYIITKTKCIGSLRNDAISEVIGLGILGQYSLKLPKILVANSYQAIENSKKYYKRNEDIFYLANAVDERIFFPRSDCELRPSITFGVITVGTIWKPKKIDRVIEIARIFSIKERSDIVGDGDGDGDQMDEIVDLAKNFGLINRTVFFHGRSDEIASLLRKSDVLFLTPDNEETPNVILEAMACGLPVIASNVGEVSRIINEGKSGFCVPPEDIMTMAERIEFLAENKKLSIEMGNIGHDFVMMNYSQKKLSEKLLQLYSR